MFHDFFSIQYYQYSYYEQTNIYLKKMISSQFKMTSNLTNGQTLIFHQILTFRDFLSIQNYKFKLYNVLMNMHNYFF